MFVHGKPAADAVYIKHAAFTFEARNYFLQSPMPQTGIKKKCEAREAEK